MTRTKGLILTVLVLVALIGLPLVIFVINEPSPTPTQPDYRFTPQSEEVVIQIKQEAEFLYLKAKNLSRTASISYLGAIIRNAADIEFKIDQALYYGQPILPQSEANLGYWQFKFDDSVSEQKTVVVEYDLHWQWAKSDSEILGDGYRTGNIFSFQPIRPKSPSRSLQEVRDLLFITQHQGQKISAILAKTPRHELNETLLSFSRADSDHNFQLDSRDFIAYTQAWLKSLSPKPL